ncbi:MAG: TolC family protein [Bacteroidia bacterium]
MKNVTAQQLLTLDSALKIALENNYSIKVAKNDAEMAKVNNYAGNAGMLPRVTGNVLQDNQTANTEQRYANPALQPKTAIGANTNQLAAQAELAWTIFDGFKMFATRNKLQELQEIGEIRMRFQMEFIFSRVIRAYFDVVQGKQLLGVNKESVKLSEDRLKLAQDRFNAGKAAMNELLNAQVDLNTDRSAMMRQANAMKNSKALLNQTIARDISIDFDVPDKIDIDSELKLEALQANAQSQNTSVMMAKKNSKVAAFGIKEIESERYPSLQFYSGYDFANQTSQSGFLQYSSSIGYHFGGGVSMNLFNGFSVDKRLQMAKISLRSNDLVLKDTMSRVEVSIQQSYNTYTMSLELLKFEKENVDVAIKNFELANDQYKIGVISSIELRAAQQNLLLAQSRYSTVQYEAKLAETELRRLSGGLLSLK